MHDFSQKDVIAIWFVQDPQVFLFLHEIDIGLLVSRNYSDAAALGHIICSAPFVIHAMDKDKH